MRSNEVSENPMNGNPPAYVLVFDPGPSTGAAWFRYGSFAGSELVSTDPVNAFGQMQRLYDLIRSGQAIGGPIVVIENFHSVGPLMRDSVATIRLAGWIEGVARLSGYEVVYHMPNVRKPYLADAKLLVGRGHPHELDATAQGLAFLARDTNRFYLAGSGLSAGRLDRSCTT
jgi:hypothetical protein